MTRSEKRKALLLIVAILVTTVIVAASLRQLDFKPGLPIPELAGAPGSAAPSEGVPVVRMHANEFVKILLGVTLGAAVLYVLGRALWSCKWRDIAAYLRQAIVLAVVAAGLPYLVMWLGRSKLRIAQELHLPPPTPTRTAPLGAPPPVLLWVVGALLLLAALVLAWWIARPRRPMTTLELIAEEAQRAWVALNSGGDLKAAIIHCYQQMSQLLAEAQGLTREEFMTTGEFETQLTRAGVPRVPVHQLTALFERVRYGCGQPTADDERTALQSLEAIIAFCQSHERKESGHD